MRISGVITASKKINQYMKLFFKTKMKHDPNFVIKPLSLIIILKYCLNANNKEREIGFLFFVILNFNDILNTWSTEG